VTPQALAGPAVTRLCVPRLAASRAPVAHGGLPG